MTDLGSSSHSRIKAFCFRTILQQTSPIAPIEQWGMPYKVK